MVPVRPIPYDFAEMLLSISAVVSGELDTHRGGGGCYMYIPRLSSRTVGTKMKFFGVIVPFKDACAAIRYVSFLFKKAQDR